MYKILILFAHPALEKSRVQIALSNAASKIKNLTFHDLYEIYPDFLINVDHEQKLLQEHDIIILQHPIYWYSCPALLKQWQDLVLEFGFAYGKDGTALKGKIMANIVSTGGTEVAYSEVGRNRHALREFLLPFEVTANLCGMDYLPPFAVHSAQRLQDDAIAQQAIRYTKVLESLQQLTKEEHIQLLQANSLDSLIASSP